MAWQIKLGFADAKVAVLAVLVGLTAQISAPAFAQETKELAPVGDWGVYFATLQSGRKICSVARFYPEERQLHFDRISSGDDYLTLYTPDLPKWQPGERHPVALILSTSGEERQLDLPAPGWPMRGADGRGVMVALDIKSQAAFDGAKSVSFMIDGVRLPALPLDQISDAFDAIRACQRDNF